MTTISKHTVTATIEGETLDVVEVEVTLDEGWAPYAQARIIIGIPSDDLLEILDPRTDARVILTLSQSFGDVYMLSALTAAWPTPNTIAEITAAYAGATLATLSEQYRNELNPSAAFPSSTRPMNLGVRELSLDHRTARVIITLESDEALLQDYAPSGTSPIVLGYTSVRDTVEYVLDQIGAVLEAGVLDDTIEADASTWEPGVNGWSFLAPLVQKAGLRLWCDEDRNWRLDETLPVLNESRLVLSHLGTITEARDTLSRAADQWCNAVVIRYEWTDGLGDRLVAYDAAVAAGGGDKVRRIAYSDTPYPGPGAAQYVLKRTAARGREVDIQAVSDYVATPGFPCIITIPNAPTQTGVVSAVTWRQPADEMTVKSRDLADTPPNAILLFPDGVAINELVGAINALDVTDY